MTKRPVIRQEVPQPSDASYRIIPLTKQQFALVDTEDYERLNAFNWHALWNRHTRSFYACRDDWSSGKRRYVYMHREIMDAQEASQIDHRSRATLDNRKENLRKCTQTLNNANQRRRRNNTSGFRGVCWQKDIGRWRAEIHFNGRKISLGCFGDAESAARAYNVAAKRYFGEFATLNLLPESDS
jgi:hypothetical protein